MNITSLTIWTLSYFVIDVLKDTELHIKVNHLKMTTYGTERWAWTKLGISRPTVAEPTVLRSTEGKTKRE
jgi:hypothetical protein